MRKKTRQVLVATLVTAALSFGVTSAALWKETQVQAETTNVDAGYNGDLSDFDSYFTVYDLPFCDEQIANHFASHIKTNKNTVVVDDTGKALKMAAGVAGTVAIRYYVGDLAVGNYKFSFDAKKGAGFALTTLNASLRSGTTINQSISLADIKTDEYTSLQAVFSVTAAKTDAYIVVYFDNATIDSDCYLMLDNLKLEKETSETGVYELQFDTNGDFEETVYVLTSNIVNQFSNHTDSNTIIDEGSNKAVKLMSRVASNGTTGIRYYVGNLEAGNYKFNLDVKKGSSVKVDSFTASLRASGASNVDCSLNIASASATEYSTVSSAFTLDTARTDAYFVIYYNNAHLDNDCYLIIDNLKLEKETSTTSVYETAYDTNGDFELFTGVKDYYKWTSAVIVNNWFVGAGAFDMAYVVRDNGNSVMKLQNATSDVGTNGTASVTKIVTKELWTNGIYKASFDLKGGSAFKSNNVGFRIRNSDGTVKYEKQVSLETIAMINSESWTTVEIEFAVTASAQSAEPRFDIWYFNDFTPDENNYLLVDNVAFEKVMSYDELEVTEEDFVYEGASIRLKKSDSDNTGDGIRFSVLLTETLYDKITSTTSIKPEFGTLIIPDDLRGSELTVATEKVEKAIADSVVTKEGIDGVIYYRWIVYVWDIPEMSYSRGFAVRGYINLDGYYLYTAEKEARSVSWVAQQAYNDSDMKDSIDRIKPYLPTVVFALGEGTGEVADVVLYDDVVYVLPDVDSLGVTAPAEKTFAGYSVYGKIYKAGSSVIINGKTTVTLLWEENV